MIFYVRKMWGISSINLDIERENCTQKISFAHAKLNKLKWKIQSVKLSGTKIEKIDLPLVE